MREIFLIFMISLGCILTSNSQTGESQFKKITISKNEILDSSATNQSQFKNVEAVKGGKSLNTEAGENNLKKSTITKNNIENSKEKENINELTTIADVDKNIPNTAPQNDNKFAIIIGNEDYSSFQTGLNQEVNVDYAANDATIFKEYAIKTIGVPQENIIFKINAKSIEMNKMVEKISVVAKSMQGDAEIYFYYAGHGFPDANTREPYLMPVDCGGDDLNFALKLSNLYKKLSESNCNRVVIFLDACFSGGARNQGLLAARGVKINPKEEIFTKNIIVFAATSEEQSALSWKEKKHGMFTYFLLKKLQETDANVTYGELSDYLAKNVGVKSALVNGKEQSPKTIIGSSIQNNWREMKIK